jgi:hypothetical protein
LRRAGLGTFLPQREIPEEIHVKHNEKAFEKFRRKVVVSDLLGIARSDALVVVARKFGKDSSFEVGWVADTRIDCILVTKKGEAFLFDTRQPFKYKITIGSYSERNLVAAAGAVNALLNGLDAIPFLSNCEITTHHVPRYKEKKLPNLELLGILKQLVEAGIPGDIGSAMALCYEPE